MIDFSNTYEAFNKYKGKEVKKTLIYNNIGYLVKFPDPVKDKKDKIFYNNNVFSEYIGSNIFKICGFNTQNTILGEYKINDKTKIVCACEDFTDNNHNLYDFENLAISVNTDKKIDTELSDIMDILDSSKNIIDVNNTKQLFWDMFIIDSIIGNTDRHNGNWGFLINKNTKTASFSPIYDCGSSLNPMLEDEEIESIDNTVLKNLAINCYSCLKEKGKKINYMSYISEMTNKDCNDALIRVFNKINLDEINDFIDGIKCINDKRKEFYKDIIRIRYDIVKKVYVKLKKEEFK